jgi:hypothetical protein
LLRILLPESGGKLMKFFVISVLAVIFFLTYSQALPSYIGYSGAPGTVGTCAGYCHGSSSGTIIVEGFPTNYIPGQSYEIKVKHDGGSIISNFNASIRVGTGTATAGIITAGLNTAVYNIGQEPNGVHFATSNRDSGTFTWTAPDSGIGEVRLYLAGMQGISYNGPNTVITLTAIEGSGLSESNLPILSNLFLAIKPTVVKEFLQIQFNVPNKLNCQLRIIEQTGRVIKSLKISDSNALTQTIIWEPINDKGKPLPAGIYFVSLESNQERLIRKFTIKTR